MNRKLFIYGFAIWLGASLALRVAGQRVLRPGPIATVILFAVSFPAMAWVVRRLCRAAQLPRDQWLAGAFAIALPTLVLDPFSTVFFRFVYPNIAPEMAAIFGAWILWCCAGAFIGAAFPLGKPQS